MFIGHFGVGLIAKRNSTLPSLAWMFVAVQLLDLIWPILVLMGIEKLSIDPGNTALTNLSFDYYPYSHSLLAAVFWSLALAGVYYLLAKNKKGSIILGVLVLSHWVLDLITHRPDLPLSPFSDTKIGLGLWNYPIIEIALELLVFGLGVWLYFRSDTFKRKISFWLMVAFLLLVHVMNLTGPPPPDTTTVAWSANLLWLIVLWAWWIERPSKKAKES